MTDFKAKMHQIRFRLGLRPDPAGGACSAPPDPLAEFGGPTSKGRRGEGKGEEERGGEGRGRGKEGRGGQDRAGEEKGKDCEPPPNIWRKFTPMQLRLLWILL